MESLAEINERDRTTLMLVTHDPRRKLLQPHRFIKDGKLAAEIHRGENRQAFFQKSSIRYRSGEGIQVSFPQFAFNNVRRNARQYFAYLLSARSWS